MRAFQRVLPSEQEILEKLSVLPVEVNRDDATWVYEFEDANHVKLRLVLEGVIGTIETQLLLNGKILSVVFQEGLTDISLSENSITAGFRFKGAETVLQITVSPNIEVNWSTMMRDI